MDEAGNQEDEQLPKGTSTRYSGNATRKSAKKTDQLGDIQVLTMINILILLLVYELLSRLAIWIQGSLIYNNTWIK